MQVVFGLPFLFMAPFACCLVPAMLAVLANMSDVEQQETGAAAGGQMQKMFAGMLNMTRAGNAPVFAPRGQNLVTLNPEGENENKPEEEGAKQEGDVEQPPAEE